MGQWRRAGEGVQRVRTARCSCPFHVHDAYLLEASGRRRGGVMLFVTHPAEVEAVRTGLVTLSRMYPDQFQWLSPPEGRSRYFIDLLTGARKFDGISTKKPDFSA